MHVHYICKGIYYMHMDTYIISVTHLFISTDQCTVLVLLRHAPCPFILLYWKQFVCKLCSVNYHIPLAVIPSERYQCDSLCLNLQKISSAVLSQISDDLDLIQ